MLTLRFLTLFSGFFAFNNLCAEELVAVSRPSVKSFGVAEGLQWLAALLLVLGIISILVWLLRKTGVLSALKQGQLSIVAGLSIGMREKLVLVRVGDKQLLLGVTPNRIDKLLELEGEQRLFQDQFLSEAEKGSFAEKLMQSMKADRDA